MAGRTSRRRVVVVLAMLAALLVAAAAAAATPEPSEQSPERTTTRDGGPGPPDEPGYAEREVLVRFEPGTPEHARADVRRRHNLDKVEDLPLPGLELTRMRGAGTPPERAREAQRDNAVRYAEPNFRWQPDGHEPVIPDDPEFDKLWGLRNIGQTGGTPGADISATHAWSVTSGSEEIVVGVIDTGTLVDHPDLADNIWINRDADGLEPAQDTTGTACPDWDCTGDGLVTFRDYAEDPRLLADSGCLVDGQVAPSTLVCHFAGDGGTRSGTTFTGDILGWDFFHDDNVVFNAEDGDTHGTHVAGTIAAVTDNALGVAGVSQARIMPLKFLGPGGGFTDDAIKALDYAIAHGAHLTNNSWGGGGHSQALDDKIAEAHAAGQLFVTSAGNAGANNNTTSTYPANYDVDNVISVAATDHDDALAGFSNYGANSVHLGAPGVSIFSTYPPGVYETAVVVGPDTTDDVGFA